MILNEDEFKCQRSWAERARDGAGWRFFSKSVSKMIEILLKVTIFTQISSQIDSKIIIFQNFVF